MTLFATILQNDTVKVIILEKQKSLFEILKEPNTIIAITSIVAILLSVFGLVYSVYYNRKSLKQSEINNDKILKQSEVYNEKILMQSEVHNKKSVEPILGIPFDLSHDDKNLKLNIINSGLGTAIITKFGLVYGNDKYNNFTDIIAKLDHPLNYKIITYKFPNNPKVTVPIAANTEICIFELRYTDMDQYLKVKSLLSKTFFDIEYVTLYGEIRKINRVVYNI